MSVIINHCHDLQTRPLICRGGGCLPELEQIKNIHKQLLHQMTNCDSGSYHTSVRWTYSYVPFLIGQIYNIEVLFNFMDKYFQLILCSIFMPLIDQKVVQCFRQTRQCARPRWIATVLLNNVQQPMFEGRPSGICLKQGKSSSVINSLVKSSNKNTYKLVNIT